MLVIDPEECIDCGACEPECPVEAIFPEDALPDKWEPFIKINYAYPDAESINELVETHATEHNVHNNPARCLERRAHKGEPARRSGAKLVNNMARLTRKADRTRPVATATTAISKAPPRL